MTIPNFCHFWLNSVTEYQPYPDLLCSALGSLSNRDSEGIENVKKAVCLDLQNNNFTCALRFFVYFFVVTARQRISFAFSELRYKLLGFNSRKICQHLTN